MVENWRKKNPIKPRRRIGLGGNLRQKFDDAFMARICLNRAIRIRRDRSAPTSGRSKTNDRQTTAGPNFTPKLADAWGRRIHHTEVSLACQLSVLQTSPDQEGGRGPFFIFF